MTQLDESWWFYKEQLQNLYKDRDRLYKKGVNCEVLNDKIRRLQKETNFSIPDKLGKEKINEK